LRRDPATIDQLRRRRLVHGSTSSADASIEAYHDRVRDVTVAGLSDDRRRELHLFIANALESSRIAEPETLAGHYRDAGDLERAPAGRRRAAAHAGATLAFGHAVTLHLESLALAADDTQRLELLAELAEAQVQAGRRNDAGAASLEAAELARRLGASAQ